MASKSFPSQPSVEALLRKLRAEPLDERRARLLASLLKVTLESATNKNGGKRPRTLH